MKTLIAAIVMGALGLVCGADEVVHPLSVSIGDGTLVRAAAALDSVAVLSEESNAELRFVSKEGEDRSITVASHRFTTRMRCDHMIVEIAESGYSINDEPLELEAVLQQMKRFSEVSKLTDSTPFTFIDAAVGIPGTKLVELLNRMYEIDKTWTVRPPGDPAERTKRGWTTPTSPPVIDVSPSFHLNPAINGGPR